MDAKPPKDCLLTSAFRKGAWGGMSPRLMGLFGVWSKSYIVCGRGSGMGCEGNSTADSPGNGGRDLSLRRITADCGRLGGETLGVGGPRLDNVLDELWVVRPRGSTSLSGAVDPSSKADMRLSGTTTTGSFWLSPPLSSRSGTG